MTMAERMRRANHANYILKKHSTSCNSARLQGGKHSQYHSSLEKLETKETCSLDTEERGRFFQRVATLPWSGGNSTKEYLVFTGEDLHSTFSSSSTEKGRLGGVGPCGKGART